jgi:hypothetical protein
MPINIIFKKKQKQSQLYLLYLINTNEKNQKIILLKIDNMIL